MADYRSDARLSVVILTYNSADFIVPCLKSLELSRRVPEEIIIADNASRDSTVEILKRYAVTSTLPIRMVELRENRGCAGGNNVGWRETSGPIVVFLNPDTEITPGFFDELVNPMMQDSRVGITGAKIYYPGGRILQHAGGFIYPNGLTEHYGWAEEDTGQYDMPREVDYVTGAGFAVRRVVLERLGGFDEDYFPAYFEETDFCTRARRAGFTVLYVPTAVMYHHESVALEVLSPAFLRLYFRMRIRYCIKNFGLRDWVFRWLPFEISWLSRPPGRRASRKLQLRAYWEGLSWLVSRKFK